jgi:DNA-binding transcriptional LysR family regulator
MRKQSLLAQRRRLITLDELAGLKRGSIRIAASQTVASYWLPRRMAAFAGAHPAVAIHLSVGNTQQVAQAVLDGVADVGFVEGVVESELLNRTAVEAVLAAVANGGSLTGVSDLAAAPHVAAGTLKRVPFDLVARRFNLLVHRKRAPSRAVAAFLEASVKTAAPDTPGAP